MSTKKTAKKADDTKIAYDRPLRVSADAEAFVRNYAAENEIGVGEAATRLIGTAKARLTALEKYRVKGAKEAKKAAAPKKAAGKKAKADALPAAQASAN